MLTHEEFTALILALAQHNDVALPLTIISGAMSKPLEDDPEHAHELADTYDVFVMSRDGKATQWYHGSDLMAIESALARIPYGQEDIYVTFRGPELYALTEPRVIAFTNAYDGAVEYATSAHACYMGSRKREAPLITSFGYYKLLGTYFGPLQFVYTYF